MKGREQSIELMKAAGIFIIVLGHVIVAPLDRLTFPIYPKQIGVALFMFVLGWNLARESRDKGQVIFQRMFPMFFFGLGCTLLVGILHYLADGNMQSSNLLPFLLGANIFFNFFPANPTLWFVGTYFHALLFWFFFGNRFTVRLWHLPILFALEVAIRAVVLAEGQAFIAYMMLPGWMTPFCLGVLMHRQGDRPESWSGAIMGLSVAAAFVAAWGLLFGVFCSGGHSFPFRRWPHGTGFPPVLLVSTLISMQYLFYAAVLFSIFRRMRAPAIISAFARNTLVIFIGHMPLINALSPWLYRMDGFWLKRGILIAVCLVGLGLFSEGITRIINLPALQQRSWLTMARFRSAP